MALVSVRWRIVSVTVSTTWARSWQSKTSRQVLLVVGGGTMKVADWPGLSSSGTPIQSRPIGPVLPRGARAHAPALACSIASGTQAMSMLVPLVRQNSAKIPMGRLVGPSSRSEASWGKDAAVATRLRFAKKTRLTNNATTRQELMRTFFTGQLYNTKGLRANSAFMLLCYLRYLKPTSDQQVQSLAGLVVESGRARRMRRRWPEPGQAISKGFMPRSSSMVSGFSTCE